MLDLKKSSLLPLALGILILIFLIPYYQKIDLAIGYAILFSVYLIIIGISTHKNGILEIIFGSILLAWSLIWVLINKLPLVSFEAIFFIIIALIFIIGGFSAYLGYIPEKWFKYLGYDS